MTKIKKNTDKIITPLKKFCIIQYLSFNSNKTWTKSVQQFEWWTTFTFGILACKITQQPCPTLSTLWALYAWHVCEANAQKMRETAALLKLKLCSGPLQAAQRLAMQMKERVSSLPSACHYLLLLGCTTALAVVVQWATASPAVASNASGRASE